LASFHLWRSLAIPAIFVLSIGIAFFSPNLAIASWVLLVVADSMAWRLWKRRNSVQGQGPY
jgi:membrane protein implicated in regulation of membrane protease activity